MESNQPNEPRLPRTLQGLIRFCMEAGSDFQSTPIAEMDTERKHWLAEALESMTVDVIKRMRDCMKVILEYIEQDEPEENRNPALTTESDGESKCCVALQKLVDCTEDIDFANDFIKIGGCNLFPVLFKVSSLDVRALAAELLAVIAQNNPFAQDYIMGISQNHWEQSDQIFKFLFSMVEGDKRNSLLARTKAFYAVSCLVRSNDAGLKLFVEVNDGLSFLLRTITNSSENLLSKSLFMLACICTDEAEKYNSYIIKMGYIPQLCSMLPNSAFDYELYHEQCLRALLALVNFASSDGVERLKLILREDMSALTTLKMQLLEIVAGKTKSFADSDDPFAEVYEHAQALVQAIDKLYGQFMIHDSEYSNNIDR